MNNGWIVARTQHQREAWAAENVVRQMAVPYLPRVADKVKTIRGFEYRSKYLFPGYIFVKCYDGRWRFLLGTMGILSVIMGAGGNPAMIQNSEIQQLKALEDSDGVIQLPKLAPSVRFKVGDQVRVNSGPYSGYVGIYDGCGPKDRERVLLAYLGRKVPLLLATNLIDLN